MKKFKVAIIIPCFKVKKHISKVLNKIPNWVDKVICVDDFCPENSGEFIKKKFKNSKIKVIFNNRNLGVGGATIKGFQEIKKNNIDFVFKVDGDNQMDLSLLRFFLIPIIKNEADFVKGNRFTKLSNFEKMPLLRVLGNVMLSFVSKISSGYWNIFDSTNGYFCMNTKILDRIPLHKISKGFFFENDLLNWFYLYRVNITDIPITAIYNNEKSNINLLSVLIFFPILFIRNFLRRIFYEYFIRRLDFVFVSCVFGFLFLSTAIYLSLNLWVTTLDSKPNNAGTVGLVLFFLIFGLQLLFYFFHSDMDNYPKKNLFIFKKK
jgi:dolichol-phosphate mannosyltransferase